MAKQISNHVLRGGSWYNGARGYRSPLRDQHEPGDCSRFNRITARFTYVLDESDDHLGFRIAKGVSDRVLRGGSRFSGARGCRSAYHNQYKPVGRSNVIGFRLARGRNVQR